METDVDGHIFCNCRLGNRKKVWRGRLFTYFTLTEDIFKDVCGMKRKTVLVSFSLFMFE